MKYSYYCILVLIVTARLFAGEISYLPTAALTIRTVDDSGKVIAGATVGIRAQEANPDFQRIGITDLDGLFKAELPSFGFLSFSAGADGYYSSWGRYAFDAGALAGDRSQWAGRRWQPWNPSVTIALTKKGETQAMYAKRLSIGALPTEGTIVGFDLEVGDWVAPRGAGKVEDVRFLATGHQDHGDDAVRLHFPGVGNGGVVIESTNEQFSELESPTEAMLSGYASTVPIDIDPSAKSTSKRVKCIIIRCRAEVNADGTLRSGRYGKIYPERGSIVYYLNGGANIRGLEFDPKRNLLKAKRSYERISRP